MANFLSAITGAPRDKDALFPLALRETVVHGLVVPNSAGAGMDGEANSTGGYIPILPAAAG